PCTRPDARPLLDARHLLSVSRARTGSPPIRGAGRGDRGASLRFAAVAHGVGRRRGLAHPGALTPPAASGRQRREAVFRTGKWASSSAARSLRILLRELP